MPTLNDTFLKALRREPTPYTPIWLMRQAGRYLPEYRKIRAEVPSFLEFCQTPALACEATLQPLRRFNLDAAIVFSDILVIPHALGLELQFVEGEGPIFPHPLRSTDDILRLQRPKIADTLGYVLETIRLCAKELANRVPLIGFAGSPWTVLTYMVEGRATRNFAKIRQMVYQQPDWLQAILQLITDTTTDYLIAQVEAGAQVLMLFDTWGGILSPSHYRTFSLAHMRTIVQALANHPSTRTTPIILFTKGGGLWLQDIAQSGCHGIGLDWTIDLDMAYQQVGGRVALQGNLDPLCLLGPTDQVRSESSRLLHLWGNAPGHIFNLGHGIEMHTPIENVQALVENVHTESRRIREG